MHNFKTKEEHAQYYQKVAREEWFKNHKIHVEIFDSDTRANAVTVIDFGEPGTNVYAVRYIFAGHYVYVSGDLGCAVFNCTWKTSPSDRHWHSLWYIHEKLAASEGEVWDFDSDVCRATMREQLLEQDKRGNHTVYPERWGTEEKAVFRALIQQAEEANSREGWATAIQEVDHLDGPVSSIDGDYWEWLYSAGNVLPARIVGIITGLQIIQEKITEEEKEQ